MAIKYICRNCGHVLYEFKKVGNSIGLLSPLEVAKLNGYICPACKSQLSVSSTSMNFKDFVQVRVKVPRFTTTVPKAVAQPITLALEH